MENAEAYRSLAEALDRLPQGYPATTSGVELEILAKLFTPEEARTALLLGSDARTPAALAEASALDQAELRRHLKSMAGKGLIAFERAPGGIGYRLMPFVVGFYERQVNRIDAEFAALFERYYREGLGAAMSARPSPHRVVPVEAAVPHGIEVLPYERASACVDAAKAWGVLDCICRLQRRLTGSGCGHRVDACLAMSPVPGAFDRAEGIRALTRDEAIALLDAAAAEGLVHTVSNAQEGIGYICNCCSCCCGILRAAREFGVVEPAARSHFICSPEAGACTGCGACFEMCPMGALSAGKDGTCSLDAARCLGCGVCVRACPALALSLKRRDSGELEVPPVTELDWETRRAANRAIEAAARERAARAKAESNG
jgi:Na+-translocating ferredoxin:NAD+ oxidoreductase subunit B